jgi:hypothetical protein
MGYFDDLTQNDLVQESARVTKRKRSFNQWTSTDVPLVLREFAKKASAAGLMSAPINRPKSFPLGNGFVLLETGEVAWRDDYSSPEDKVVNAFVKAALGLSWDAPSFVKAKATEALVCYLRGCWRNTVREIGRGSN